MKEFRTIRLLLSLFRSLRWALPATILLGLISGLAESAGLSLFAPLLQVLDHSAFPADGPRLLALYFRFVMHLLPPQNPLPYIVLLILLLTVCKGLLVCAHSVLSARINSHATQALQTRIFGRLLDISQARLEKDGTGRLINLLATDTWQAGDALSQFISIVVNGCSIIVFASLLLALSWKLTLLVGLGVVVVSLPLHGVAAMTRKLGREAFQVNTRLSEQMIDALDGLREIQIYGLQKHRTSLFKALSSRVRSIHFRLDLFNRLIAPVSEVLYISLLLGLLLIGVAGVSSISSVAVFLLVLYRMQPHIRQFDSGRLSMAALTAPVEAVHAFLATSPDPAALPNSPAEIPLFEHAIEFDEVSFSYDDSRETAVRGISFQIPFGKTTAIVGPSGSGKTTLVSLLCRFYDPQTGTIRVDGSPLNEIRPADWRSRIAWVSQDAHIFSASVMENIGCGRLGASDEEILQAAKAAGADEFVADLPDGYLTKIGNGGEQLSSGQTQRIALARAFLRQPALLILDEATNALDSISEWRVREHLGSRRADCAVLIISHRLSTVFNADRVIVLSNGSISEQGAPRDLSRARGLFSRFVELQHVE